MPWSVSSITRSRAETAWRRSYAALIRSPLCRPRIHIWRTGPDGRILASTTARQFVMVGICGGYTTFSSFSLQTLNLVNDGEWLYAAANTFGSVLLCFFSVWAGHAIAASMGGMKFT